MITARVKGHSISSQLHAALLTHSQLAVSHSSPRITFLARKHFGQQHPCICQSSQKLWLREARANPGIHIHELIILIYLSSWARAQVVRTSDLQAPLRKAHGLGEEGSTCARSHIFPQVMASQIYSSASWVTHTSGKDDRNLCHGSRWLLLPTPDTSSQWTAQSIKLGWS